MQVRSVLLVPLLIATAEAAPCEVSIPTAPVDVRIEIERWVRAEPRCGQPLEVRVVPTEGSFYLFARDPAGRVRERVVPDAQSAGVLVASWIADDSVPAIELAPVLLETASATAPRPRLRRWVSLGGLQRMEGGGGRGLRGELDVTSRGPWSFGVAVAGSDSNTMPAFQTSDGMQADFTSLTTRDVRVMATVSRTVRSDAFELRLAGGAGIVHTSATGSVGAASVWGGFATMETVGPIAEVSAQASLRLGGRWAIGIGPLVSWFVRSELSGRMLDDGTASARMPLQVSRDRLDVSMLAALRTRI